MVYKQGWAARMPCYDRLLRSVMDMIEVVAHIMKADGMSEPVEDLGKALVAIESAWTKVTDLALASPEGEREQRGIEGPDPP